MGQSSDHDEKFKPIAGDEKSQSHSLEDTVQYSKLDLTGVDAALSLLATKKTKTLMASPHAAPSPAVAAETLDAEALFEDISIIGRFPTIAPLVELSPETDFGYESSEVKDLASLLEGSVSILPPPPPDENIIDKTTESIDTMDSTEIEIIDE